MLLDLCADIYDHLLLACSERDWRINMKAAINKSVLLWSLLRVGHGYNKEVH